MVGLDVTESIGNAIGEVSGFVSEHPVGVALGVAGAGLAGAGLVALAVSGRKKSSRRKTKRGTRRDRRFISKQKHERKRVRKRAGKIYGRKGKWLSRTKKASSRRKGSKKVYYARKTGQPYILLASGKAKFIKGKRRKR